MSTLLSSIIGLTTGSIIGYAIAYIQVKYENKSKRQKKHREDSKRRLERDCQTLD